ELAVELPEPRVVAHPVRAEMDEPRLAHTAVVVGGRVARLARVRGIPVDALQDVGDAELVAVVEARDPPPILVAQPQRLHAVEAHAHPDVPADHVGDAQRALHQWADLVALLDVLPPPRVGAARSFALVLRVDLGDLLLGVGLDRHLVVLAALLRLFALGADHEPVLAREHLVVVAEDLRRPFVDGPLGELALLVEDADERVAPVHAPPRPQRSPPLAGARRVERVDAPQRVAPHQLRVLGRDLGDLVLADQGVASGERGGRDRPAPPCARGVRGVAPQRVVVAVGLGDVAERVLVRAAVVRRLRVRLGDVDACPQRGDPLVGDAGRLATLAHASAPFPLRFWFFPAMRSMIDATVALNSGCSIDQSCWARSRSIASSSSVKNTDARSVSRVRRSSSGGRDASLAATARASAGSSRSETQRHASPASTASRAESDSPSSVSATARRKPTARSSRQQKPPPGWMPTSSQRQSKRALGDTRTTSHASATLMPAPTAGPLTAATVGSRDSAM